jgi:hypothetical protein
MVVYLKFWNESRLTFSIGPMRSGSANRKSVCGSSGSPFDSRVIAANLANSERPDMTTSSSGGPSIKATVLISRSQ